jgi:putative membrane protein
VDQVYGTIVGRWYVTVLGLVFVLRGSRHLGWRRTAVYTLVALTVGALAENASVRYGVPYTGYDFNDALRDDELFLGDVPLMVPLSYTFLGYLGFAAGRMVASGPRRTRGDRPWQEYALGVLLTVWPLWILDPVSRLGDEWFLGELFRYRGPGFWFGLPVGSQVGFTLTAAVLVGVLTYLMRDEPDRQVAGWLHHPHQAALVTWHAQVAWLAVVAVVLGETELGGSALLMYVPAALVTSVLWSRSPASSPPGTAPEERPERLHV